MTHRIQNMPVLVLYAHRRCNCRCLMCDIWKDTTREELSVAELQRHLDDIQRLGVRWVVLSGGEPLMHSDLFRLSSLLRACGIRVTILTTGLLLARHARAIAETIDDVIVSLDGPEAIHDRIRGVPGAFRRIACGIRALHEIDPAFPVSARSTVQQLNFRALTETAAAAHALECRSISFLAADLSATAFNRSGPWTRVEQQPIALSEEQIPQLESAVQQLLSEWAGSGFIAEDAIKFARIVRHFRASLGLAEPVAPRCNAPWVSAVIESDGTVRPCFFHDPIGRVGTAGLLEVLNGFQALTFRSSLNIEANPVCQRCVCSLNWVANT